MEGWCLHQNTQEWLAHLLGVVHYIATTHRFGTIQLQSGDFAFFADPPLELWPPAKLPYVSAPRNLARWRRLSGPTSCMTSLTAGFGVKLAAPLQSQNWEKWNFDPPYQKYFFYNSPFDMNRCGLQRCTAGAWAVFMHFRLPLYDEPFLKYRMSKANLLIFSNIFHFTFWPITFFPY
jgi:hypothetical protein